MSMALLYLGLDDEAEGVGVLGEPASLEGPLKCRPCGRHPPAGPFTGR